jgi:RNA polymerase sigma-70 factor (ECF subfamily)
LELSDIGFIGLLTESNEQAFEKIFTEWFGNLYAYAYSVLKDEAMAEEVVQSVICRIWENGEQLKVYTSMRAYLCGSVYHECINWLRQEKNRQAHTDT